MSPSAPDHTSKSQSFDTSCPIIPLAVATNSSNALSSRKVIKINFRMRVERVEFCNTSGELIIGDLHYPEPDEGNDVGSRSRRAIILCHGLAANRNGSFLPELANFLSLRGYHVLRFDFRGSGESPGVWSYANYDGEVADILTAAKFLERTFSVPLYGLIGHSKAATEVLLYASKYPVSKVISVSGRFDMSVNPAGRFSEEQAAALKATGVCEWQGLQVTQAALDERAALDVEKIVRECTRNSLGKALLIHAQDDKIIPFGESIKMHEIGRDSGNMEISILKSGGHGFRGSRARGELMDVIWRFLAE